MTVRDSRWPFFESDEISAVADVLRSGNVNYWTGSLCREFEEKFSRKFTLGYSLSCANGTVGLELALRGLGLPSGAKILVTPRSFVASASVVFNLGMIPVFADLCPLSGNISAETIDEALRIHEDIAAIICVHLGGLPCEMPNIMELAHTEGIKVIEDCSQAHGAMVNEKYVGSFGHAAVWSFCQDKIMSTGGEGGIVAFQKQQDWEAAWSYRDHGKSVRELASETGGSGADYKWVHHARGSNFRMTEMQAAIGLCQLVKLDGWISRRNELSQTITKFSESVEDLRLPRLSDPAYINAFYRLYLLREEWLIQPESRWAFIRALRAAGFRSGLGSCCELYREKVFKTYCSEEFFLPVASHFQQTSCAIWISHRTTEEELHSLLSCLRTQLDHSERG